MGLFDHLFKPKTDSANEEHVEAASLAETAPSAGAAVNVPPPKPPAIAPPATAFSPRSLGQVVTPGRAGPAQRSGPAEPRSKAGGAEEKVVREIVLTLDDVLARIPKELLTESAHDGRRALRFAIDGLSADIARGRAAVPLSQIAAQCPDIFCVPIDEDNDVLVRLPLQKLVEQIAPAGISAVLSRTPGGESADAKIHLSIAAILRTCPREIIIGELPPVADTERIVFPFAPIERQLPSGRVDVSSIRFVAALPLHMHEYFRALEGVRVPLPLDEIFQNLPGQAVAPAGVPSPAVAPGSASTPGASVTVAPMPVFAPTPAPASVSAPAPASEPAPAPIPVPVFASPPLPVSESAPSFAPELTAPPTPAPEPEPLAGPAETPAIVSALVPEPPVQETVLAPASISSPPVEEPAPVPPEVVPSTPPLPAPQVDLAKDEIAELRARIAALKVEFDVSSAALGLSSPAAPPPVVPPVMETPAVSASLPASSDPISSRLAPSVPFVPAPEPRPGIPPSLGFERASSGPPPVSVSAPESASAPSPELASAPVPTATPMPELFRPPLVPPPVGPVVVAGVPKIEPPAPVMLPVRIVAPPPMRPHVAPPPLFSAGANVALPEIHPPAPAAAPEPPAPPPPPPPPLMLERVGAVLGIGETPTLADVAEDLTTLPGLAACVLDVRHEAATAGSFPEGLEAGAVRKLATPLAAALAGREGEHITIFSEHGSISVFAHGTARLVVLHRARVFLPGVRERLAAATEALAEA